MDETLTVATLNMQFGQAWDPVDPENAPVQLEDTIGLLRDVDADVFCLQEVEHVDLERGQIHPPPNYCRILEALAGYRGYFAYPPQDPDELPFGYGLAILSRFPLEDCASTPLPTADLQFDFFGASKRPTRRLMIEARLRFGMTRIQLLNTHLQAFFMLGTSSDIHRDQRDLVAARLKRVEGPGLLAGDFNCVPEESTLEQFAQAGFEAIQKSTVTWKHRPYVLDHILHNGPIECLEHKVLQTDVSDHDLVWARFRVVS